VFSRVVSSFLLSIFILFIYRKKKNELILRRPLLQLRDNKLKNIFKISVGGGLVQLYKFHDQFFRILTDVGGMENIFLCATAIIHLLVHMRISQTGK